MEEQAENSDARTTPGRWSSPKIGRAREGKERGRKEKMDGWVVEISKGCSGKHRWA